MSPSQRPPRAPARLLARLLGSGQFAESVIGDLAEEWSARLARGDRFNLAWYWRQCAGIGLRVFVARAVSEPLHALLAVGRQDPVSTARAMRGDLSRGLRSIVRQPLLVGLSSVAIALGVASPTTIFSIVRGLSRDLPFENGDRVVYVTQANPLTGERDWGLTEPVLTALSKHQTSLEGIAAFSVQPVSLVDGSGPAVRYSSARISPSAFSLLRVRPETGTAFTDRDALDALDVALISDAVWRQRFGAAPDVIGRTVRLNGRPTRITGVMPADFRFPFKEDVWLPLAVRPGFAGGPVKAFGRLRRGVTAPAADAEFATIGARVVRDPAAPDLKVMTRVLPFKESQLEPSDVLLFRAMILVVSMVLLVACANVANLLLAHVSARGSLFAVKVALGASRGAIIREMLAESAFMAGLGGVGGVLLATAAIRWFNDSVSEAIPSFWMSVSIDKTTLGFALALVAVATVTAGLVPALYASRTDPAAALRGQAVGSRSHGATKAMRVLLTMEVALSCALLAIAGVMTKGAFRGRQVNLLVDPARIVSAQVDLGLLAGAPAQARFVEQAMAAAATDQRLSAVAFTTVLPGMAGTQTRLSLGGETVSRNADLPRTRMAVVSPRYFTVLGTRARRGRLLADDDVMGHAAVAVVNDAFVRAHLATRQPIGARVVIHDGADTSSVVVVGTVPDLSTVSSDQSVVELIMVPFAQHPADAVSVLAVGAGLLRTTAAIRDLVRTIDPDVPVTHIQTLTEAIALKRRASWSLAYVFAECGLAGLLLTALGLYGVAETSSRRRVRELAIRRALGASRRGIVALVVGEAAVPLAMGVISGTAVALLAAPALRDLLFGENPRDPLVLGTVTVVLTAVMLFAAARPAVWAARAPITETLRR